jgi:hypothetical protein
MKVFGHGAEEKWGVLGQVDVQTLGAGAGDSDLAHC